MLLTHLQTHGTPADDEAALTVSEFNQHVAFNLKAVRAISTHERIRLTSFCRQRLIPFACWALIFEQHATSPRRVRVPPVETWDPMCGAFANTEDLNVDNWFCEGRIITSINCFPGTDCRLRNGYDIVTLQPIPRRYGGPDDVNTNIRHNFYANVIGNLMVFKRSQTDNSRVVNITSPEISLVRAMVQRYVPHLFILSACSLTVSVAGWRYGLLVKRRRNMCIVRYVLLWFE